MKHVNYEEHMRRRSASGKERRRPSEEALEAAGIAAEFAREQPLRIRHRLFDLQPWVQQQSKQEALPGMEDARPEQQSLDGLTAVQPPPLVRLLQETGGRDAIRPKLVLSMFWIVQNQVEVFTNEEFAFWAYLLDLDNPDEGGARRIRESIARLGAAKEDDPCSRLFNVQPKPPQPPRVGILHESGNGSRWFPPNPKKNGPSDYFLELPVEFWTNGWLARMSGAALVSFLILASARSFENPKKPVWISHERLDQHHHMSPRTWQAGLRELRELQLISSTKTRLASSKLPMASRINVNVHIEKLQEPPEPTWD